MVIGSGIAAQRLSPGDVGLQLFENAAATAAGLYAIILMVGPVSGAHLNPVVSLVDAVFGGIRWWAAAAYIPVQVAGCVGGAVVANLMFSDAAVTISVKHRASGGHTLFEGVATLGLLLVIFALARSGRGKSAAAAVGAYIGAAYFFTSSTGFANPAITVGRMFSNTFAGIAPASAPTFIGAQVVGGLVAVGVIRVAVSESDSGRGRRTSSAPAPRTGPVDKTDGGSHSVTKPPVVLFLCTHNAGRSLAARVLLDHYAGGRVDVRSAGSEPGDQLNPAVVSVLRHRGLDPSRGVSQSPDQDRPTGGRCHRHHGLRGRLPSVPATRDLDWDLDDPAGQPVETVRPIVDEIDRRVRALLAELLESPAG